MIAQSSRQITAQDEAEDSQVQSRIGLYLGLRIYSLMKKKDMTCNTLLKFE